MLMNLCTYNGFRRQEGNESGGQAPVWSGLVWVWRLDLGVEYVSQALWAVAVCTPYALIVRASGRDECAGWTSLPHASTASLPARSVPMATAPRCGQNRACHCCRPARPSLSPKQPLADCAACSLLCSLLSAAFPILPPSSPLRPHPEHVDPCFLTALFTSHGVFFVIFRTSSFITR